MGPGFLVSIAYIDPGNCKVLCLPPQLTYIFPFYKVLKINRGIFFPDISVETDLQSGAQYKYEVNVFSELKTIFYCTLYVDLNYQPSISLCVIASVDYTFSLLCCSCHTIPCGQVRSCNRYLQF